MPDGKWPAGFFAPPPHALPPLDGLGLHLLGVRGRGMRAAAMAAVARGARVDGCDVRGGRDEQLEARGIRVSAGHDVGHLPGRRLVATTLAPPDNRELRAAIDAGVAHHRSDLLGALCRGRRALAVTGTHGKGTVAALAAVGLIELGADPFVVLGVTAPQLGGAVRPGGGPVVVEADESDGTIDRVVAEVSLVTNVSSDHPQYRRTVRDALESLAAHVAGVPPGGRVILGSGPHAGTLERAARAAVWRLGRDFAARVLECGARGTRLRLEGPGGDTAVARLRLRTTHPADNAALAYAALRALGWSADEAAGALGRLTGLARRLEQVGTADSVTVVDDFGKHPGCIGRTLAVLRARTAGKILAVYEAHRHEHVSRWGRRLAAALGAADAVAVLPVNDRVLRARRRVPPDWFRVAGLRAEPVADPARATEWVTRQARPGDVVCVLGVHDDLGQLAHRILAALRARGRG